MRRNDTKPSLSIARKMPPMHLLQQDIEQAVACFSWFSKQHQNEAYGYLSALEIARERNLKRQIAHYKQELRRIVSADVKDRVAVWAQQKLGFPAFSYYRDPSFVVPTEQFTGPYLTQQDEVFYWLYYPIGEFSNIVPPFAIHALTALEETGITPQAYWVADLTKKPTPTITLNNNRRFRSAPAKLDPVLCAQFYRWFVGIAAWV